MGPCGETTEPQSLAKGINKGTKQHCGAPGAQGRLRRPAQLNNDSGRLWEAGQFKTGERKLATR